MKRISSLVLAAAFVFGSMGVAQAIDTKVKGTWDFTFGWGTHTGFQDSKQAGGGNDDYFHARQRVRSQINFIASENLQAVLMFEIGALDWGNDKEGKIGNGSGASLDSDGINIKTRRAYLDWLLPDTGVSVRMGIQDLHLPMATRYANPAFSADVAGVVTSYTFDETFAVTAFWARPFNQMNGSGTNSLDKTDMFGLILPVTLDGVSITPWGTIARIGEQSGAVEYMSGLKTNQTVDPTNGKKYSTLSGDRDQTTTLWWTGLGINVDLFDPLTFALDVMYGRMGKVDSISYDSDKKTYEKGLAARASGWFLASTLDYKLDWGTPGLFGWWSTGDKAKDLMNNKLGRMPVLGLDDGFNPTSFGFADNMALSEGTAISTSGMGTWGIGLQIADLSFIEDLSHVVRVAYITGTNKSNIVKDSATNGLDVDDLMLNGDNVYLTNKDHALEVNFISSYQIYENLSATLDLSYINLDLDKKTWTSAYVKNHDSDAWKAQVNLKYDF